MALNGTTLTQVGEETLYSIMAQVPMFGAITTDFSANVANGGSAVVTRIANTGSVITLDGTTQTQATTPVTVTLGANRGCDIPLTDLEYSTSTIGDLRRMFIEPSVNAIVKAVNDEILALVTGSVHSNSYSGSIANFGADEVSDAVKDLAGYNPTALVLDPSLSNVLRKDVAEYQVIGSDSVIRSGTVGKIYGLSHYQTNGTFKDNILGFACAKNALVMASRVAALPQTFNGEVVTVQDKSGFAIQLRLWYSQDDYKWRMSCGAIWGVARGVSPALRTFIAS